MKVIGIIPARFNSTRFPGKPLADICGRPMVWWVYQQTIKSKNIDEVYVATDDERIVTVCKQNDIKCIITSKEHDTPTSRLYEVSQKIIGDLYVFIGGDEPLIETEAIDLVISQALKSNADVTHAMTKITTSPEVIDFTNIKVVVNTEGFLLYTSRSPLPYPKGGLDFDYMKFVGIGVFTKNALNIYNDTPKSALEKIEECDLIRFLEKDIKVKMVEVNYRDISVDTPKDLAEVIKIITQLQANNKTHTGEEN